MISNFCRIVSGEVLWRFEDAKKVLGPSSPDLGGPESETSDLGLDHPERSHPLNSSFGLSS